MLMALRWQVLLVLLQPLRLHLRIEETAHREDEVVRGELAGQGERVRLRVGGEAAEGRGQRGEEREEPFSCKAQLGHGPSGHRPAR